MNDPQLIANDITQSLREWEKRCLAQAAALRALLDKPKPMMICPAILCPISCLAKQAHGYGTGCDTPKCSRNADRQTGCIPVSEPAAPVREIDRAELQKRIDNTREFARLCSFSADSPLLKSMSDLESLADGRARIKGAGQEITYYCHVAKRQCFDWINIPCWLCQFFAEAASGWARNQNFTEHK